MAHAEVMRGIARKRWQCAHCRETQPARGKREGDREMQVGQEREKDVSNGAKGQEVDFCSPGTSGQPRGNICESQPENQVRRDCHLMLKSD